MPRIIRDRRIHRSMPHGSTRRRRDYPPNVLLVLIPHLDPKGQIARDVVQVRIG
jgi:hypothetical protein